MSGAGVRLLALALLVLSGGAGFELQDTITALMEENIHLHDQLEELSRALRELRQLLRHHTDPDHGHNDVPQRLLNEWSQHGVSADTHLLLKKALCGHDSAGPLHEHSPLLLLLCCAPLLLAIGLV